LKNWLMFSINYSCALKPGEKVLLEAIDILARVYQGGGSRRRQGGRVGHSCC